MNFICSSCSTRYPLDTREWVCAQCGGLFEIENAPRFDPLQINSTDATLWRYRALIPLPANAAPVSLGEGFTPLVETRLNDATFFAKLDYLQPSGSFKDRGTTVLISALTAFGVTRALDDSSGNAAASLSAYAARAGIAAEIFVPAHASPAKLAQIQIYGARLNKIEGARENAARAVQDAAKKGDAYYASHYYNPFVLAGMKTTAWEIWEQLNRRAPDAVIAPVGHGSNFIGLARGFADLQNAGLIEKIPRLIAAQADVIAPLARAAERGLDESPAVAPARTIAEGIAISQPVRGKEILRVVKQSRGAVIAMSEDAIASARNELARVGLYVEPTSATAVAALLQAKDIFQPNDTIVIT
ncbi:MAG: pyridoxal-phosphate dependent enzyme, partial [Chloroflexi bacterium]|nr:pyridoxal-phosphate dependent enzyme [Chloroflexota bacterium]